MAAAEVAIRAQVAEAVAEGETAERCGTSDLPHQQAPVICLISISIS
jgi:hypothetical protein